MANTPTRVRNVKISSKLSDDRVCEVEILLNELLDPDYSAYIWPCATILAQYLCSNPDDVSGVSVLELGAGTGLPGLTAACLGAKRLWLTDRPEERVLNNLREAVRLNSTGLAADTVVVRGLSWGEFGPDIHEIPPIGLLLVADCFYDPKGVFILAI